MYFTLKRHYFYCILHSNAIIFVNFHEISWIFLKFLDFLEIFVLDARVQVLLDHRKLALARPREKACEEHREAKETPYNGKKI